MIFVSFLLILWILLLVLLKRKNMAFFLFAAGSIGMFLLLMYMGTGTIESYLGYGVTYIMYIFGKVTGMISAYPGYLSVTVNYKLQAVSFFIDYECSGIIETLVYICLLSFYPLYSWRMKGFLAAAGAFYIFAANVARIFVICSIVKLFGPAAFFISHTVIARFLFFILTVILYYIVFTKPHILKQKVGEPAGGNR
ncbi:MAG: exosortase family protein XrtG [Bacillota bacterium]|nr:exosortase family protein XrtG [Bacillota bacterium]